jgi:hypothetical protein
MGGGGALGNIGSGGGSGSGGTDVRYVDEKLKPIDANRLRTALTSTNPDDAYLKVAKRMPIRLQLQMDLRKINRLLAECGNSRLPVEVRQVRLNRGASGGSMGGGAGGMMGGGGAGGMMGGGGMGGLGGLGGGGMGGGGMGGGGMGGGALGGMGGGGAMGGMGGGGGGMGNSNSRALTISYDGPVEIYGLIYLFNPPNQPAPTGAQAGSAAATNVPRS